MPDFTPQDGLKLTPFQVMAANHYKSKDTSVDKARRVRGRVAPNPSTA